MPETEHKMEFCDNKTILGLFYIYLISFQSDPFTVVTINLLEIHKNKVRNAVRSLNHIVSTYGLTSLFFYCGNNFIFEKI